MNKITNFLLFLFILVIFSVSVIAINEPTFKKISHDWNGLKIDENNRWYLENDSFSFTALDFSAYINEKTTITITKLFKDPVKKFRFNRPVYRYVGLEQTIGTSENLKDFYVTFKVDKTWLKVNNLRKEQIVLYRYDSTWKSLPTKIIEEANTYIRYRSRIPDFGFFCISNIDVNIITTTTSTTTINPTTSTTTTTLNPKKSQDLKKGNYSALNDSESLPTEEFPQSNSNSNKLITFGSIIVLVFALIASSLFFFSKIKPELNNKNSSNQKVVKPKSNFNSQGIMFQKDPFVKVPMHNVIKQNLIKKPVQKEVNSNQIDSKYKDDLEESLNKSNNSVVFIEKELESLNKEIKDTKKEVVKKLESKVDSSSNIERFIIRKFISDLIEKGMSDEIISMKLKRKGYYSEEISSEINSIRHYKNLNYKLKDISEKLWKKYEEAKNV